MRSGTKPPVRTVFSHRFNYRPGDDKRPVMRHAEQIIPALRRQIQLVAEEEVAALLNAANAASSSVSGRAAGSTPAALI